MRGHHVRRFLHEGFSDYFFIHNITDEQKVDLVEATNVRSGKADCSLEKHGMIFISLPPGQEDGWKQRTSMQPGVKSVEYNYKRQLY